MDIEKLSRALEGLTEGAASGKTFDRRVSIPFTNYSTEGLPLSPDSAAAMNGVNSNESSRRSSSQSEAILTPEEEARCRSNLYVSLLGEDVTDVDLRAIFDPFGPIESAVVMRNIHTGKSRGIAFVQFLDVDAAKRALESVNGMVLRGRAICVQVASRKALYAPGTPTNRVFVRNIPADVGEGVLSRHFSSYGEVLKITLHNDSAKAQAMVQSGAGGPSLASPPSTAVASPPSRIAFVTFPTVELAKKAAAAIHNSTPFPSCRDVPLLAKVAEDSTKRMERISRSQSLSSTPTSADVSRRASNEVQVSLGAVLNSVAADTSTSVGPAAISHPVPPEPVETSPSPPQTLQETQMQAQQSAATRLNASVGLTAPPPPVLPPQQIHPFLAPIAGHQHGIHLAQPFHMQPPGSPFAFQPQLPIQGLQQPTFSIPAHYAALYQQQVPFPQVGFAPQMPMPYFPPPYPGMVGGMFSLVPAQNSNAQLGPPGVSIPGLPMSSVSFAPRYQQQAGAFFPQPLVAPVIQPSHSRQYNPK